MAVPLLSNNSFIVRVYDLSKDWLQNELFAELNFGHTVVEKDPLEAHYRNSLIFREGSFLIYNTDLLASQDNKDAVEIVKLNK